MRARSRARAPAPPALGSLRDAPEDTRAARGASPQEEDEPTNQTDPTVVRPKRDEEKDAPGVPDADAQNPDTQTRRGFELVVSEPELPSLALSAAMPPYDDALVSFAHAEMRALKQTQNHSAGDSAASGRTAAFGAFDANAAEAFVRDAPPVGPPPASFAGDLRRAHTGGFGVVSNDARRKPADAFAREESLETAARSARLYQEAAARERDVCLFLRDAAPPAAPPTDWFDFEYAPQAGAYAAQPQAAYVAAYQPQQQTAQGQPHAYAAYAQQPQQSAEQQQQGQQHQHAQQAEAGQQHGEWQTHYSEGRAYYYNTVTGETRWA